MKEYKILPELSSQSCHANAVICHITFNQCWEIVSHKPDRGGYVILCHNYKRNLAHRISYEVYKGKIPNGYCVCHKCDNRSCINPDHLFVGTYQDNTQDMISKKGRFNTKLTINQVQEIRGMFRSTNISMKKLGRQFNVSSTCIREIVNNISWRNID